MILTRHLSANNTEVSANLPIRTDNQGNAYNVANYKARNGRTTPYYWKWHYTSITLASTQSYLTPIGKTIHGQTN